MEECTGSAPKTPMCQWAHICKQFRVQCAYAQKGRALHWVGLICHKACEMTHKDEPSLIRLARESGQNSQVEPLDLGERVRALRKERKLTLEQAAQQAGMARSTLSKIENAQMSPTFDALKKLALGLDISIP